MPRGIQIFGKKLQAKRIAKYLNQPTLAQRAEMSVENVKRLERDEVTATDAENIPKLAAALEMALPDFEAEFVVDGRIDVASVLVPSVIKAEAARRAKADGISLDEWVGAALEAVLRIQGWRPGGAVTTTPAQKTPKRAGVYGRLAAKKKGD